MLLEHSQRLECLSKIQLNSVPNNLTSLNFLYSCAVPIKLDQGHTEEPLLTSRWLQNFRTQV